MASRKAQTGNWQQAGEIWQEAVKTSKRKFAGRACYNLALVSEVNGDLDQAMQWAQKSYEDYNNKYALYYMRILEDRKRNLNRLGDQEAEDVSRNSKP